MLPSNVIPVGYLHHEMSIFTFVQIEICHQMVLTKLSDIHLRVSYMQNMQQKRCQYC